MNSTVVIQKKRMHRFYCTIWHDNNAIKTERNIMIELIKDELNMPKMFSLNI